MNNKKIIGAGIGALCLILLIVLFTNRGIEGFNKNAIGETDITKKTYGYPIISLLGYNSKQLTVEAGYYRFGDVNLDAVVDKNDIEEIKLIIDSKMYFSNGQKLLADVDESGSVDEDDITRFNEYLKENGPVNYDLHTETLEYCVVKVNDSSNCNWTKSNVFDLTEKVDYYVYVRQKNTQIESESTIFEKEGMNEKERLKY